MTRLWQLERIAVSGAIRPRFAADALSIDQGITAIVGSSGAGKSTLLNLLVNFAGPDFGRVNRPEASIAWAGDGSGLWHDCSVREHCSLVAPQGTDIDAILADFDLAEIAAARPGRCSAGERVRVDLARAVASGAEVMVLDEPVAHLDPSHAEQCWQAVIKHVEDGGRSLVYATHRPDLVLGWAQQVVCLNAGSVLFAGSTDTCYWRPPNLAAARCLGPVNWLDADLAGWIEGELPADQTCVRPEQLRVRPDEAAESVVTASRFHGSHAEITLQRDEQERRFVHRPRGPGLRIGSRVALHLSMLVLLVCAGCGGTPAGDFPPITDAAISTWNLPPAGPKLPAPRAATLLRNGGSALLDTEGRVLLYDADDQLVSSWWMPAYDVGRPEGIRELADGSLVVADTHYHRVVIFSADGSSWRSFGSKGEGPGEFIFPVGLTLDPAGHIYVSEYGGNDRVQKFTADGEFLLEFGSLGLEPGQFQRPAGLAWRDGRIYVADAHNNRVQVFSDDGQFIAVLGGEQAPTLHFPYDIGIGPDDRAYVVEYGGNCLSVLSLEGAAIGRIGHGGSLVGELITPWGLTVVAANKVLVADTGNHRMVRISW